MADRTSRRTFLRTTGVAAIGVGVGGPMLAALASGVVEDEPTGTRWALVIDTKKCRKEDGCEDCVAACHSTHNVPDIGTEKEAVKWIWKEPYYKAFPGQVQRHMQEGLKEMPSIVLCNHCENPPCVRVCPTGSTWKREDGVVMMDMHRCIGCRYCIVACPYGSRSFNWRDPDPYIDKETFNNDYPTRTKGVVEKCNLCAERLAKGQIPKCAEVCEHGAIVFGDVNDPNSDVRKLLSTERTIRRKPALGTDPHVFYIV